MQPRAEVWLLSSLANQQSHLSASLGAISQVTGTDRAYQSEPPAPAATWSPMAMASPGPVAGVEVEDRRNAGYGCHPAVADSSMHVGILAGSVDGKVRIPGVSLFRAYPDGLDSYSYEDLQDGLRESEHMS